MVYFYRLKRIRIITKRYTFFKKKQTAISYNLFLINKPFNSLHRSQSSTFNCFFSLLFTCAFFTAVFFIFTFRITTLHFFVFFFFLYHDFKFLMIYLKKSMKLDIFPISTLKQNRQKNSFSKPRQN